MGRITVRAWKRIVNIENLHLNEEQLDNLKLSEGYAWTNTQIATEDILEHYEYKASGATPTKTVVEFTDARTPMIIKEPFDDFSARLKEIESIEKVQFLIQNAETEFEEDDEEEEPEEDDDDSPQ